eukprot:scaffold250144_cov15-Tisochrysis_lutea.AAC.1
MQAAARNRSPGVTRSKRHSGGLGPEAINRGSAYWLALPPSLDTQTVTSAFWNLTSASASMDAFRHLSEACELMLATPAEVPDAKGATMILQERCEQH